MWGTFLEESSPHPSKNLNQWLVGEDIILPLIMPLCRETRDTGDTGNFLRRKFPEPFKEFAGGLRKQCLVSRHFAYGKTMVYFAEDSRVCKHPLLALGQNPPEFPPPRGENSVPRQGV